MFHRCERTWGGGETPGSGGPGRSDPGEESSHILEDVVISAKDFELCPDVFEEEVQDFSQGHDYSIRLRFEQSFQYQCGEWTGGARSQRGELPRARTQAADVEQKKRLRETFRRNK